MPPLSGPRERCSFPFLCRDGVGVVLTLQLPFQYSKRGKGPGKRKQRIGKGMLLEVLLEGGVGVQRL